MPSLFVIVEMSCRPTETMHTETREKRTREHTGAVWPPTPAKIVTSWPGGLSQFGSKGWDFGSGLVCEGLSNNEVFQIRMV
jgi:hypothetical protein